MTIFNVSDASGLTNALGSASGGDTINLADGSYGDYSFSSLPFDSFVDIQAVNNLGATFTGMDFTNCNRIRLTGVYAERQEQQPAAPMITLDNCSHIQFRDSEFTSVRTHDTSAMFYFEGGCDSCGVYDSEVSRTIDVFTMEDGTNYEFIGNHVNHFVQSGWRLSVNGRVDGCLIKSNHVHDHKEFDEPNPPDNPHGSVFAVRGSSNVTVTLNHVHDSRLGWMQLYVDAGVEYHYENIEFSYNLVYDINSASFIHSPGGDNTFAGYFRYNHNTFIAGWMDDNWTAGVDDFEDRLLAQGPDTSTQVAKFPEATEAKNNLAVAILDDPSGFLTNSIVYWSFFGVGGSIIDLSTIGDNTYIDDDMFVNPHYSTAQHGLTHGVDIDFTPKAGSNALTASDTGSWVGAVNPETGLLGPDGASSPVPDTSRKLLAL